MNEKATLKGDHHLLSLSLSRSSFVTYTEEEARDAHRWSNYYRSRW